jgi:hypothetical protein
MILYNEIPNKTMRLSPDHKILLLTINDDFNKEIKALRRAFDIDIANPIEEKGINHLKNSTTFKKECEMLCEQYLFPSSAIYLSSGTI